MPVSNNFQSRLLATDFKRSPGVGGVTIEAPLLSSLDGRMGVILYQESREL
jgi:hypothetical protein